MGVQNEVKKGAGRPLGSGRWGQYAGKLRRVYVPEGIADSLPEFVQGIIELIEDFEYLTSTYSESPRKKLAREMVLQLQEMKNLVTQFPLKDS